MKKISLVEFICLTLLICSIVAIIDGTIYIII